MDLITKIDTLATRVTEIVELLASRNDYGCYIYELRCTIQGLINDIVPILKAIAMALAAYVLLKFVYYMCLAPEVVNRKRINGMDLKINDIQEQLAQLLESKKNS